MTPDPVAQFVEQILATIEAHDLLPRDANRGEPARNVVVGVSGGPDSVALLRVLHDLSRPRDVPDRPAALPIAPVVAHLHHGLRGRAADEDQAFVRDLAARLELPLETAAADVPAEAEAAGLGIEEAARLARRAFLADVARRHRATRVALGHTADDRAETVLFRILRGTGVEGLAALGPRAPLTAPLTPSPSPTEGRGEQRVLRGGSEDVLRGGSPDPPRAEHGIEIIRPLIDVRRSLVLAYLSALGQPYREDETNSSDAHTRNRVRSTLLPLLRQEFNPKVDEALSRLADQASAASRVLEDAVDAVWRQIVREAPDAVEPDAGASGGAVPVAILLDADDFAPLRPWLQGAILRRAIERLGGGLKHMSAERTREVVDALLAKTVVGPIDLPGGLAAARRRRAIRIVKGSAEPA